MDGMVIRTQPAEPKSKSDGVTNSRLDTNVQEVLAPYGP